jgi:hypothetical protein
MLMLKSIAGAATESPRRAMTALSAPELGGFQMARRACAMKGKRSRFMVRGVSRT